MVMDITPRKFSIEQGLFSLAFFLALAVRFLNLGAQPLTDLEARSALQALEIAKGSRPLLGPQPAYLILTAVNFFIFGASNFLARFWPALAGAGLVLAPIAFKRQLGQKAAILLAFFLALDPGLLALSRMADSQIMAIGFVVLCLAAWHSKRYAMAGALGGMALLSGPFAWFGLTGLGLFQILLRREIGFLKKSQSIPDEREAESEDPVQTTTQNPGELESDEPHDPVQVINPLKTSLLWGVAAMLLVGTMFFMVPNGLSAWAGSISEFIKGWWTPSQVKPWVLLVAMPFYVPMAVIFGLIGLVRGISKPNKESIQLPLLSAIFLLMALIYPARQVGNLGWMLVPFWGLAAVELSRYMDLGLVRKWEIWLACVVTFSFLVFAWLEMLGIPAALSNPTILQTRFFLMIGALLLMILSMFLIATAWDGYIARIGIVWGSGLALILFTISAGMNSGGLRLPFSAELWQPAAQFVQADLLVKTANDLSDWRVGQVKNLNITIPTSLESPSLLWLFRDWNVEQVDALALDASPDLVLMAPGVELSLPSAYRGQDFILRQSPVWEGVTMDGWLRWIALRVLPVQSEFVVLWAREDLFLDGGTSLPNPSIP
jgi:hypothetical protein